jgi:hypothetical protein
MAGNGPSWTISIDQRVASCPAAPAASSAENSPCPPDHLLPPCGCPDQWRSTENRHPPRMQLLDAEREARQRKKRRRSAQQAQAELRIYARSSLPTALCPSPPGDRHSCHSRESGNPPHSVTPPPSLVDCVVGVRFFSLAGGGALPSARPGGVEELHSTRSGSPYIPTLSVGMCVQTLGVKCKITQPLRFFL